MGGSVAIAIKRKGKLTTRILPKYSAAGLCRGDFYEGNGLFWEEWEKRSSTVFVPEGYGLVVIDMEKKWAAGIQGYADFQETNIRLHREEDIKDFKRIWEQDRVKKVSIYSPAADIQLRIACGKTRPEFAAVMKTVKGKCDENDSLILDIRPPQGWKIAQFSEDPEGWTDFIAHLRAKGVEIRKPDLTEWEKYLLGQIETSSPLDAVKAQQLAEQLDQTTPQAPAPSRAKRM